MSSSYKDLNKLYYTLIINQSYSYSQKRISQTTEFIISINFIKNFELTHSLDRREKPFTSRFAKPFINCYNTRRTPSSHSTVEIPDSIKFFMTHNQNTQPIQCQYAV